MSADRALEGVRVLDLGDAWSAYGSRLLADLGADVILVEPPTGSPLRRRPPLRADGPDDLRSVPFLTGSLNKRSLVTDLETPRGRDVFAELVRGADAVIESGPPGWMNALGVGYAQLEADCPWLTWCAITPFGQDGPRAGHRLSELTAQAAAGALYVTGEPTQRPVMAGGRVVEKMTGYTAALAVAIAVYAQRRDGLGQFIDLSIQEACAGQMESFNTEYWHTGHVFTREGRFYPRVAPAGLFPAADGWVSVIVGTREHWSTLRDWVGDARLMDEQLEDPAIRLPARRFIEGIVEAWVADKPKEWLFREGQARKLPVSISQAPDEVLRDPQLLERRYFAPVAVPGRGRVAVPAIAYHLSATPLRLERPAPALGEHTDEIRAEVRRRRTNASEAGKSSEALAGIRVLELGWYIAAPACTKHLADHGAEVIKVESERSMDPLRSTGPWLRGVNTAPDGGALFTQLNRNKRSVDLDLKTPGGRECFLKLVAASDVVVDNYTAGAMARLGLGYEVLSQVNPRLVMAELSGMGQTGPYRSFSAYGHTLMSLAGGYDVTGERGGPPLMPGYTLADYAAGSIAALAVTAALQWREASGKGQYIDFGQLQVVASLFAEDQVAAALDLPIPTRQGNVEPLAVVHDVFPTRGEDTWCAIVAWDAVEATTLREIVSTEMGECPPPGAPEFNRTLSRWTARYEPWALAERLQASGIEAAPVESARMLVEDDRHLAERGFFVEVDHLLGERVPVDGVPYRMSRTPATVRTPGPIFGGDTAHVLRDVLGMDAEAVTALRSGGAIG